MKNKILKYETIRKELKKIKHEEYWKKIKETYKLNKIKKIKVN